MVFDSIEGYSTYLVAQNNFVSSTSVGQEHASDTKLIFSQHIGYKDDLKYISFRGSDDYFGIPVLGVWGGSFKFGVMSGEAQLKISIRDTYVLIPILDWVAGGMTYDTWKSTNDDWTFAWAAQFSTATLITLSWALSYLFGPGFLILASWAHICLELLTVLLIWDAESSVANTTNGATQLGYVAAGFGILGDIFINIATFFGPGIGRKGPQL